MPKCNNCGGFVTPDFARVFGDNRNDVNGCVSCMSFRELQNGEGAAIAVASQSR